jgi:hypothetical protein
MFDDAEKNEIDITPYSKTIQHFRERQRPLHSNVIFDEWNKYKRRFTNQEELDKFKRIPN